jgi:hypothetical protein
MNKAVADQIVRIRGKLDTKEHSEMLADLFLEDSIDCVVKEMRWDTMPHHKVTLIVEVYL